MFSHLPSLNSIRVFDAAARLLSFKLAALELNVTATAVSHQIRALEDKLGALLFERKTRSIDLTPEGERLATVANQSLQQLGHVIDEISNQQTVLTVSTTSSFAAQWLVPKLEDFHQRYNDIQVVVKTGEALDDLLKDRRVDVAIRYGQFDSELAYSVKLTTERFGMYATPSYLQSHPQLKAATLIETAWKNVQLPPITWQQYFQNKGVDSHGQFQASHVRRFDQEQHVIQAALAGQGIALVSELLIQTALKQGWLVKHPQGEIVAGLTYSMLTSIHQHNSLKVHCFREWLLEELAIRMD
ncbi:LysR substrate-binding domain-containing protein [Shewanella surugensis]|uniref:LysR substrate-binding domain-containing protein n=1 Tax=Shewanella surugensis TaxID=212020 RepID=A0ABT0LJ92_9GAMM|nr:LysR substrate-binding domain-containing protein [Shewanella surugensis]MCL1127748.1 LysR substrate-binding domain-containing protein [Shewanella surugensis]